EPEARSGRGTGREARTRRQARPRREARVGSSPRPRSPRTLARGGVAEWPIAAVLKTVVPQGTGGSNPSASAMFPVDIARLDPLRACLLAAMSSADKSGSGAGPSSRSFALLAVMLGLAVGAAVLFLT